MSPRRKRVNRIIELRERELGQKVEQLSTSRNAEAEARLAADAERQRLAEAARQRGELGEGRASAHEWIQANEWLIDRDQCRRVAEVRQARAQAVVVRAQAAVVQANTSLKQVQLLDQRLAGAECSAEERAEQRLFDELGARRLTDLRSPRGKRGQD